MSKTGSWTNREKEKDTGGLSHIKTKLVRLLENRKFSASQVCFLVFSKELLMDNIKKEQPHF